MNPVQVTRGLALSPFDCYDMGKTIGSKYPHCKCCPYGFHIDLDFVRYCEELRHRNKFPSNKRRRERQRRKSMEVLMGLTSDSMWDVVQQLPVIPQETVPDGISPETLKTNEMVTDALYDVVQDFELTLERAGGLNYEENKQSDLKIGTGTYLPFEHGTSANSEHDFNTGTNSVQPVTQYILHNSYHEATPPADFDSSSICSGASGLSTYALQNVRQQMVLCLERIRELENEVKIIPSLKVQLSVLKDEKRKLLLQLRSDVFHQSLEDIQPKSEDLYLAKSTKGLSCDGSLLKSHRAYDSSEMFPKQFVKDAATLATVMTRDVGVSPNVLKMRDIATSADNNFSNLSLSEMKNLDIAPDFYYSDKQNDNSTLINNRNLFMNSIPYNVVSTESKHQKKDKHMFTDKSVFTDLDDIRQKLKIIEYHDQGIQVNDRFWKLDVYCQTNKKPLMNDAVSQIHNSQWQQDAAVQVEYFTRRTNRGVQYDRVQLKHVWTQCESFAHHKETDTFSKQFFSDVSVGTHVTVKDIGCSESTIHDNLCNKCSTVKKDVSISCDLISPDPKIDSTFVSLSSLDIMQHQLSGTNTSVRQTSPKFTDTSDLYKSRMCDIGVNTQKKKLVDAAAGSDDVKSSLTLCSSCNASIHAEKVEAKHQDAVSIQKIHPVGSRIPLPISPISSRAMTSIKMFSDIPARRASYTSECTSEATNSADTNFVCEDQKVNICNNTLDSPLETDIVSSISLSKACTKREPSKEMKAAMKVLNDALSKSHPKNVTHNVKNAVNIIQQEWFQVSSISAAVPADVESYLDAFEAISPALLQYIVNMANGSGNTSMHYAVSHGNFDVVSILLDSKVCNINQPNAAGYTCVMLLSLAEITSETHKQVVRRLFQFADVNVRAKQHGQTALMLAVSHGRLDTVKLLIEAGADINIQDEDGSTALMCAAEHGHQEIVKQLLSHSECDVTIRDCDGTTALDIAMDAGNRDIGVLIYAHEMFTRGRSPYGSLRHRRSKSATPTMRSQAIPVVFQSSRSPNLSVQ